MSAVMEYVTCLWPKSQPDARHEVPTRCPSKWKKRSKAPDWSTTFFRLLVPSRTFSRPPFPRRRAGPLPRRRTVEVVRRPTNSAIAGIIKILGAINFCFLQYDSISGDLVLVGYRAHTMLGNARKLEALLSRGLYVFLGGPCCMCSFQAPFFPPAMPLPRGQAGGHNLRPVLLLLLLPVRYWPPIAPDRSCRPHAARVLRQGRVRRCLCLGLAYSARGGSAEKMFFPPGSQPEHATKALRAQVGSQGRFRRGLCYKHQLFSPRCLVASCLATFPGPRCGWPGGGGTPRCPASPGPHLVCINSFIFFPSPRRPLNRRAPVSPDCSPPFPQACCWTG